MKRIITTISLLTIIPLSAMTSGNQHTTNSFRESLKVLFLPTFNKYIASPYYHTFMGSQKPERYEDASPEYQSLHQEAQRILNIPKELQLPVKKINSVNKPWFFNYGTIATTFPDVVLINEEIINSYCAAEQKQTFLHEAAHIKNCDTTRSVLTHFPTLIGYYFCAKKVVSAIIKKPLKFGIRGPIGIFAGWCAYSSYEQPLVERRADAMAYNALNCHKCLLDCASSAHSDSEKNSSRMFTQGYFSKEKIMALAETFKKQNKVCEDHKNKN